MEKVVKIMIRASSRKDDIVPESTCL